MIKISDYLTVGDAAAFVGVSKDTLRRWDRAGKLKARRHPVTGYRLYLKTHLDDFLGQIGDGRTIVKRSARVKRRIGIRKR